MGRGHCSVTYLTPDMQYPKWLPYPSAWLNALLLLLLLSGVGVVMRWLFYYSIAIATRGATVETFIAMVILISLLPIVLIAIVHHILHLWMSRYAPSLKAPEIGTISGFFPTLFSWWAGIVGWAAMIFSCLGVTLVATLTYKLFGIDAEAIAYRLALGEYGIIPHLYGKTFDRFVLLQSLSWLTFSAYIYHCYQCVEENLIAATKRSVYQSMRQNNQNNQNNRPRSRWEDIDLG
jgi:hypothetical protein